MSDRYPFTPPLIMFITPVYHPNIDPQGRICLTALKPKPSGTWSVTLNIPTVQTNLNYPTLKDTKYLIVYKINGFCRFWVLFGSFCRNLIYPTRWWLILQRNTVRIIPSIKRKQWNLLVNTRRKKFKPDPCSEATVFVCFVLTRYKGTSVITKNWSLILTMIHIIL